MQVTARQYETLDALCYRIYGRTAGITEAAFEANPGLADEGPILPYGRMIYLPKPVTQPIQRVIQLWD